MANRRDTYAGDEMVDVFDKASEVQTDPNFRNQTVGNRIKRILGDGEYLEDGSGQRQPGSDVQDPYGSAVKPKGVPYWDKVPETEAEKSLYQGVHIHSEDNPLGLHTHIPGGKLGGGHGHSPSNPHGVHFHGPDLTGTQGHSVDGRHIHKVNQNMPAGPHEHQPGNFA